MSNVTVTINSYGVPTPSSVPAGLGDTVTFVADGADVVLCIDPEVYFGGGRFEIPDGDALDLTVQSVEGGAFDFIIRVGDLSARCGGGRGDGGEMGGSGGT